MANALEVVKSIKAFGGTGRLSNPIGELAWVLQQTVREDCAQAKQILGDTGNQGLIENSMFYVQRMIEIGYIFTEVFVRDEYKNWQPKSDTPRIIDLGGDPGAMSVLYWRYRAPNAQITVIEANPATFNVMRKNLARRGLEDIQVINAAVAGEIDGDATLYLHRPRKGYHTQDYVGKQSMTDSDAFTVTVPKVKLSTLIKEKEHIDLLKMDIEGSEGDVMCELAQSGKLGQVDQIIMEFHHDPVTNPENSLIKMLNILRIGGFTIEEAHITIGKGIRNKKKVLLNNIEDIANINSKVFLTFSAIRTQKK